MARLFDFFLVLVTFGLAIYTAKLWHATKELAKDAKNTAARQAAEMQESLRIAEISAKATEKAAEAAKQSADAIPSTERAFLFVTIEFKGGNTMTSENGDRCGSFIAKITNHGKTPALLTKLFFDTVLQTDYPKEFIETDDTNFPPGCAISSGADTCAEKRFNLSPTNLEKIKQNELNFYCYGRLEYTDIFGFFHKTGFCYHLISHNDLIGLNISRNNDLNYYT